MFCGDSACVKARIGFALVGLVCAGRAGLQPAKQCWRAAFLAKAVKRSVPRRCLAAPAGASAASAARGSARAAAGALSICVRAQLSNCGLSGVTVKALEARGITALFPIQKHVFEPARDGKDLIGRARTGSGKTLAFSLPVIEELLKARAAALRCGSSA